MVNCNPETVSTDYDTSDKLYFEPLTREDVLSIIEREKPEGVIVQFGGQTPLKLAVPLRGGGRADHRHARPTRIDRAEDRKRFAALLDQLGLRQPPNGIALTVDEAVEAASRIGYPVLVRPSYVLGGRAMEIVYDEDVAARLHGPRRRDRPGPAGAGRPVPRGRHRARRRRDLATARPWSSPASWSTSSAPACTPATAPVRCRPTRCRQTVLDDVRRQVIALAHRARRHRADERPVRGARAATSTSSRSTRAPRAPCRSSAR